MHGRFFLRVTVDLLDVHLVFDLTRQPLDSFVESFTCDSVGGADVPRLVCYPFKSQNLEKG